MTLPALMPDAGAVSSRACVVKMGTNMSINTPKWYTHTHTHMRNLRAFLSGKLGDLKQCSGLAHKNIRKIRKEEVMTLAGTGLSIV